MADQVVEVTAGFFDAVEHDRTYYADQMNNPYKRIVSNGVFATPDGTPSTDFQVTSNGTMILSIAPGNGIIAGKWFESKAIIPITVPGNTGIVPRIDSVILQVDLRIEGRVGNVVYRTGEPAEEPEPPLIDQVDNVVEYRVANIYVAAGADAINQSDISDMRGSEECPWITSLIYQVDTSELFRQYQAAYASTFEAFTESAEDFYQTATGDYEEYKEQQQSNWEAFIEGLAEDLTVSTNVISLNSLYTPTTDTKIIPINLASFNPDEDILLVYINGFRAVPGYHYSINAGGTSITLTAPVSVGQVVSFTAIKSVITGNLSTVQNLIQALESKLARIASDTGWSALTINSNFAAYDANSTPEIRCVGDRVYLRGSVKKVSDATGNMIAALPLGMRPSKIHAYVSAVVGAEAITPVVLEISTEGYLTFTFLGTLETDARIPVDTEFVLESLYAAESSSDIELTSSDDGEGNVTVTII